jgi:steroid 5-alpha reductase family enzyme
VSWGPLLVNLVVTAVLVAALMLATFAYAMRTRVHAIMDTIWPLGFVLIAVVSFFLSAGSGVLGRRLLMLVLVTVWGLRLGAHIYLRNRGQGEDKRYASLLRRNTGSLAGFVLRYIYWAQGRVMWFVSLPVQVAMYSRAALGFVSWLGVAVWAVGFGFEAVGDLQLRRFRADPANAGRVLDRGLWRYTRHPNYFGDAVVWFGLWLLACSHWLGFVLVVSPVYMTNMLVRHTGKRLLEKHMARSKGAAYAEYVRRTSGFVPWPPRRPRRLRDDSGSYWCGAGAGRRGRWAARVRRWAARVRARRWAARAAHDSHVPQEPRTPPLPRVVGPDPGRHPPGKRHRWSIHAAGAASMEHRCRGGWACGGQH